MKYFSTRGGDERLSFEETVLAGLAPNGGLYIPSSIPTLPKNWETEWEKLSFTELALEIYSLYISTSEIGRDELAKLIERSYSTFDHPSIAPVRHLDPSTAVLELWHGPTFAFKDVALQFLGNLFEFFLARKNATRPAHERQRITVVGATSGDTGSAAIYGLRGKTDVSIFILHPKGRVSPIQEAQMTTVLDPNVFNLAVEGTFDDCQDIVKSLFSDSTFKQQYQLGAINSINWARILAQIVYYFSSYFELRRTASRIQYVVPTGNFGDILAGFYACRMGLPMGSEDGSCPGLVVATNANDILTRNREVTKHGIVKETLSPAMDILVSSNFERLLFHLAFDTLTSEDQSEPEKIRHTQSQVNKWMQELKAEGKFVVPPQTLTAARRVFAAGRASDNDTCETIRAHFERPGDSYIVDPHTAVGLCVAKRQAQTNPFELFQLVLATAHPAKFSEAVAKALGGSKQLNGFEFDRDVLPAAFRGLLEKPRRTIDISGIEVWRTREVVTREVERLFGQN
ncbi:hypothetical protein CROQUDRAFT_26266, partial [Cronartium quercuum f. sp. fusiforme G11]